MIEARDLTKEFKIPVKKSGLSGAVRQLIRGEYTSKTAVEKVNFTIEQGEAVAYLGPNGAGKSTTIKMLTGILKPSSGEVLVNGIDPQKKRIQNSKSIGVVFGQRTQLWWDIPIEESFMLLKDIYEIPDKIYNENINIFNEIFKLSEFMGKSARRLSLGQRMRADLAAALLHNPSIVFLDEPTIGLDIETKEAMRHLIRKINQKKNVSIILTSHDLKDVENICKRIIVIDYGKIICDKDITRLTDEYSMERELKITLSAPCTHMSEELNHLEGVSSMRIIDSHTIEIYFMPNLRTAFELVNLVNQYIKIKDFKLTEPNIERIVEKIYNSGRREQA